MLEMIRRIFKIAGRSRQKIIVGITFNILKSFFNGFMMFGVFWILLPVSYTHLTLPTN